MFTLVNAPAFASIVNANTAQRTATLRLAPTTAGAFDNVRVQADDGKGGKTQSAAITITVNEPQTGNRAPVVENIPNQTVTRGQSIEFDVRASDADGDPVTFALDSAPAFVTISRANATSRTATVRVAPPLGDTTTLLTLRVIADDGRGGRTPSNNFTITIDTGNTSNRPPVAVANRLPDTLLADSSNQAAVSLDGSASSDPDGDQLSFTWLDRGTAIASGVTAQVRLPLGEHQITLRVSDGRGGVSTTNAQTVTVVANPVASLSVTNVTPSTGKVGRTLTIAVTGTGFVPGTDVDISGNGITTATTYLNGTQVNVRVTISSSALTTLRNLIIVNPSGDSLVKANAFAVVP